jgi:DUF971 family protein
MIAHKIRLQSSDRLVIEWDDGHEGIHSLRKLRDECPCAGCRGETVLLKTYQPERQSETPAGYELAAIEQVGHYAIKISWKDGHSTGIYDWEYLRSLCECEECQKKNVQSE